MVKRMLFLVMSILYKYLRNYYCRCGICFPKTINCFLGHFKARVRFVRLFIVCYLLLIIWCTYNDNKCKLFKAFHVICDFTIILLFEYLLVSRALNSKWCGLKFESQARVPTLLINIICCCGYWKIALKEAEIDKKIMFFEFEYWEAKTSCSRVRVHIRMLYFQHFSIKDNVILSFAFHNNYPI